MPHFDPPSFVRRTYRKLAQVAPMCRDRGIVMYHGIDCRCEAHFFPRFLSQDQLRTQIRHFKKEYAIVPLADIFSRDHDAKKPFLAITFDDGRRNNFLYALPVIKEEEVPATFFITSIGDAGKDILWSDAIGIFTRYHVGSFEYHGLMFRKSDGLLVNDELGINLNAYAMTLPPEVRYELVDQLRKELYIDFERDQSVWALLDEHDLAELASSHFVEIGSHGHTHTNLDLLSRAELVHELKCSKEYLEQSSGREVVSLAYPNGAYTRHVIELAENLGYEFQVTVNYHYLEDLEDPRIHDRFGLFPDQSTAEPAHSTSEILRQVRNRYRKEPVVAA